MISILVMKEMRQHASKKMEMREDGELRRGEVYSTYGLKREVVRK